VTASLKKFIIIILGVQIILLGSFVCAEEKGRQDLVQSQRDGCERIKLDRIDNAGGWRAAENARREAGDDDVADTYAALATRLERRSKINCAEVYP